jgi:hypothetical protein
MNEAEGKVRRSNAGFESALDDLGKKIEGTASKVGKIRRIARRPREIATPYVERTAVAVRDNPDIVIWSVAGLIGGLALWLLLRSLPSERIPRVEAA